MGPEHMIKLLCFWNVDKGTLKGELTQSACKTNVLD